MSIMEVLEKLTILTFQFPSKDKCGLNFTSPDL